METAAVAVAEQIASSNALNGLLSVDPHDALLCPRSAASRSLVLRLSRLQGNDEDVFLSRLRRALDAAAALERASHALDGFPEAKRAFWRLVLDHPKYRRLLVDERSIAHFHALDTEHDEFPHIVVDLSRAKFSTRTAGTIGEWLLGSGKESSRCVPITLRLQGCKIAPSTMAMMSVVLNPQQSVEGGAHGPGFWVSRLDLSSVGLDDSAMNALAAVVPSAWRPLDWLILDNVLVKSLTDKSLAAFRALIRAVAGIAGLPSSTITSSGKVRGLSLAYNSLSFKQIGVVCSALHHPSSSIRELCLAHTVSVIHPDERRMAWVWLALGVSRNAADIELGNGRPPLERIDLSGNPIFPIEVEIFTATLELPIATISAEAQPPPSRRCKLSEPGKNLFATPGVKMDDKFYSEAQDAEVFLEALGVLDNKWVIFILPGYGFACALPTVVTFEDTASLGTNAASQRRVPLVTALELSEMTASDTTAASVCALIERVGGNLRSLAATRTPGLSSTDLAALLASCPHLEHLNLDGIRLINWEPLCQALQLHLRLSLRSLNIRCNPVGFIAAGRLGSILSGLDFPVLEELRLGQTHLGIQGVEELTQALAVNKKLQLLELPAPHPQASNEDYMDLCFTLEVSHQGELLGVNPLPLQCKLAFLSALLFKNDDAASLLLGEEAVVRLVFSFAATDRHRRLVWWKRAT